MTTNFYGFDDDMFSGTQKVKFHTFKTGEHNFRILPPFAKGQLYLQVDLHWGFTDENGSKKVLKCTKYSHKTCAICDEVDRQTSEIEMAEKNPTGFSNQEEFKMFIDEKKKARDDIKRKSTYLWNILLPDGGAKVLQLSWNGHEPLLNKVKFLWEKSKVNVTDPTNNRQMWCSRTGVGAKTRYQYEVVENSARPLDNIGEIVDLTKVYKENTPAELKAIIESGFVKNTTEDPNDRSFAADMPMLNEQKETAPAGAYKEPQAETTVAPATSQPAAVQQNTVQAPITNTTAPVAQPNIDDDIAKMEAILKGNQGVF